MALANGGPTEVCPVNMKITFEEDSAFRGFNVRLSHLRGHFGQPTYEKKLVEILEKAWPEEQVIDISPVFMERTLNLVEQQHLKHLIAQTIGFDNRNWREFERAMRNVTLFNSILDNRNRNFIKLSERLMEDVERVKVRNMRRKGLSDNEGELLRARTATTLANMYIYLQRWDVLNRLISEQEVAALKRKILTLGIGVVAIGVVVTGTIYMGSILGVASAIGAKFASDVVVAANLARLAQVVAGAGLGAVGGPAVVVTQESAKAHFNALKNSRNNRTLYTCEIDKQIEVWKNKGVSPYLKASLLGAGMGMGGVLSFHAIGAKALLAATTFSVTVAQAYTLGKLHHNTVLALAEYRYAMEAQERGDREAALAHLHKSREYSALAKEDLLNSVIIGVLSVSIATSLKPALIKGEEVIRVMYANSADTLPEAVRMAREAFGSMGN